MTDLERKAPAAYNHAVTALPLPVELGQIIGIRAALLAVADHLVPVNGCGFVASPPEPRAIRALLTGEQR